VNVLFESWWRILVAALLATITRVLMLQLLPLSPTFELPLSPISRAIGMIPTALSVVAASYLAIAIMLVLLRPNMTENRIGSVACCTLSFSAFWFVGVLETVPALGMALVPELKVALADIVPLIVLGLVIGLRTPGISHRQRIRRPVRYISMVATIAAVYFVGRYFLYAVVHVNSGYAAREASTFVWTLAMGLAIGTAYVLLREGLGEQDPAPRGLWFGVALFGVVWALFNFFMPIVFDMSFIKFHPAILNYVWRVAVDILAVTIGVWWAESAAAEEQDKPEQFPGANR
jgi:hypothetical protein